MEEESVPLHPPYSSPWPSTSKTGPLDTDLDLEGFDGFFCRDRLGDREEDRDRDDSRRRRLSLLSPLSFFSFLSFFPFLSFFFRSLFSFFRRFRRPSSDVLRRRFLQES